ncbi:MAG: hypothetical protein ABR910_10955 [Acidobacteriaceae bacterium]|jgi:hypothetical protein
MKEVLISAILLSGICFDPVWAQSPPQLSVTEARQFALAALSAKQKRMPGFGLDIDPSANEPLYVFNATWQGLPDGSVEIGFYAVDPVTGTVWNAVMECEQVTTPKLRELQANWIKYSGFTKSKLLKFRAPGPQCPTKGDVSH